MPNIGYSYACVPTIREFSRSQAFIRGLMGPFGSGKSSGCIIDLVRLAVRQPIGRNGKRNSRFVIVRNTYPQLRDTTIKTVEQWLPWPQFGDFYIADHSYKLNRLDPDLSVELLFRALDRPEHVANLLSLECTAAWVNEAREVPYQIISALQGRVGRYPPVADGGCVDPCIIMDTNPPDDEHWWYELFEVRKPDNALLFRQPSGRGDKAENLPHLRPGYYATLAANPDPDFVKVYVDGEYGSVKDGKPVYPEYVDSLHCRDIEYQRGLVIYRGWDFGLTPACVFSQLLPDGTWNTFAELTADSVGIHTLADAVLEHSSHNYPGAKYIDLGDPAGDARTAARADIASCFDVLRAKGILIEAGEQALPIRLGSVKKALATLIGPTPQLVVHSRCKVLRKGYQGRYQYRRVKVTGAEERYHDVPDKNEYSHPHDANQYVAARLFGAALTLPHPVAREPDKYRRPPARRASVWAG